MPGIVQPGAIAKTGTKSAQVALQSHHGVETCGVVVPSARDKSAIEDELGWPERIKRRTPPRMRSRSARVNDTMFRPLSRAGSSPPPDELPRGALCRANTRQPPPRSLACYRSDPIRTVAIATRDTRDPDVRSVFAVGRLWESVNRVQSRAPVPAQARTRGWPRDRRAWLRRNHCRNRFAAEC
jgi:hypothetical protein